MALGQIKARLIKVSASEFIELEAFVAQLGQRRAVEVALERRCETITSSVRCGKDDLVRWGRSKAGTQRFKCRACNATFGATNNTVFFRLRNRQLWAKYLGLMGQHIPLWRLQKDHGLPLSLPTLHRWRHRFLATLTAEPAQPLAGMIEADEKFFRT